MRYLITAFFYFCIQNIAFSSPIKDFTARYEIYHNGFFVGQAARKLTHDKEFIIFSSEAKTAGMASWFFDVTITEASKLKLVNNKLNFYSFDYYKKKNSETETHKLHLDGENKFYNSYKKQHFPVTNDLHDTLGFIAAIMHDLKIGQRTIPYTVAEKTKVERYLLKFIKKENLTTSSGDITTLKMEHYDPKKDQRITIWCAPDMDYLPIKILNINNNGDENLLHLTHHNQRPIYLNLDEDENEL